MAKIGTIAMKLAIEAKSCGLQHDVASVCIDAGFYRNADMPGDANVLADEAFYALLDEVDAALPFARLDCRIAADWCQAGQDNDIASMAERREGWDAWAA